MHPFAALLVAAVVAAAPAQSTHEQRTEAAFSAARASGPLALHAFLDDMPKGADLHNHLSGAVYAESWIRAAGEDGLCVDPDKLSFHPAPCVAPLIDAKTLPRTNPALYDKLVDVFSMRGFVPTDGWTGHDHFFASFDHFRGVSPAHTGEWIHEVVKLAAEQNEQYVELMDTPEFGHAAGLAHQAAQQNPDWANDFAAMREKLLAAGLRDEVAKDREHIHAALAERNRIEHCGTPEATKACSVKVEFIYQILRAFSPEQVFAQTLLGFETIAVGNGQDGEFLGINFVQPEDNYTAMTDYSLHMKMLDYLHSVYPQVHITLHAGELAPGLVPPDGLRFHIREAVELGHAERIGHGVDVMYEDHPEELLKELAAKHVMIEINLSSNDGILGVRGKSHPLPLYRAAGVPVSLSTDDEGVNRSTMTEEFEKAATDFPLSYADLKQMTRTGLEHTFLPGASLWAAPDSFTRAAAPCSAQQLGAEHPTASCKAFLDNSPKAQQQWELEHRFTAFEERF